MNKTIFDKFSEDILNDEYFKDLFKKISLLYADGLFNFSNQNNSLSHIEYTHLLRFADILSNSSESIPRNKSYQIISILNYNYNQDPIYKTYSNAVFAKLGNFPAIQYLSEKNDNNAELPFDRTFELDVKKIIQTVPDSDGLVFTDAQYTLFNKLSNSKFFSFSAPTSMGKSFLIKSFIRKALSNKPPENLVIMVPTRALINQFALDLMKELNEALGKFNYKIVTNSNVTDFSNEMSKNYIFVLTPERLISYLSQKDNPSLGFIFVDEAHKIASEKDMRSVTSYIAIQNTLKKFPNINLYFASPNVSNPEVFLHLFNKEINNSFHTIESPVSQNLFFIDLLEKSITQYVDEKSYDHETDFFDKIKETNQVIRHLGDGNNNIVYCNSKPRTIEKSFEFYKQMKHENVETNKEVKRAIKQIKTYIHKDYYLATFLESGIAYHYGNLPQIIRNIVEELYRKEHIQYIFCTSTLLEGVNLPAKNIFILVNKNGLSAFTPIDFWNLAGRAGRLSKELSGNIYCIKDNVKEWKDTGILIKKEEIVLKPTVFSKTDGNLKRIEKLLLNKTISGTQTEKNILEYIANIICIDTMEIDTEYKSPLIQKLIEKNKNEIIEYAKNKTINLKVPLSILNSNQSIGLNIQNKVYLSVSENPVKLPKVDYDACLEFLNVFYDLYEWGNTETNLKNKKSLKYYAFLMNQWINGISLNQIINQSISYHDEHSETFYINHKPIGKFDKNNKEHINEIINNIIEDIEKILRYNFEKYFNHYYLILTDIFGEENAGANWAQFLEYGTQNRLIIALQNLGFSRHSSNYIFKNHKNCLIIENGKLKKINKNKLLSNIDKKSIEYDEIKSII